MSDCKCDMRTRLVGDGCEVCNPSLAAELSGKCEVEDDQLITAVKCLSLEALADSAWDMMAYTIRELREDVQKLASVDTPSTI